jgi:hypothetical protein
VILRCRSGVVAATGGSGRFNFRTIGPPFAALTIGLVLIGRDEGCDPIFVISVRGVVVRAAVSCLGWPATTFPSLRSGFTVFCFFPGGHGVLASSSHGLFAPLDTALTNVVPSSNEPVEVDVIPPADLAPGLLRTARAESDTGGLRAATGVDPGVEVLCRSIVRLHLASNLAISLRVS